MPSDRSPDDPAGYAEQLALVGSALPVATAVVSGDDYRLLYGNPEFCEMTGHAPGKAAGSLADLFVDAAEVAELLDRAAAGEQIRNSALALEGPNGTRWLEASVSRIADLSAPGALSVALRDVTAHRELEAQVTEMARFPDMNPGPVLRFDRAGTILGTNDATRQLFGIDELDGASWTEICPGMDQARWTAIVEAEGDQSVEVEMDDRCFVFAHVADPFGEVFFAFGADITAVRDANRRVAEQAEQLTEVARFPDMNPGPVLQLDRRTEILLANRAALDLFGPDTTGQRWANICPEFDDWFWQKLVRSDDFMTLERRVGDRQFIFFHRCDSKSHRVFVYGADVTEQRRADELIRLLLASTGEGIYGVDRRGKCTFANPAAVRILGFDRDDDLLGEHMHSLVHHTRVDGEPYPIEECRINLALRERKSIHADDEVMWRRDGSSFPAEYWAFPMEMDGEMIGSVSTFIDITERREVQEELALAKVAAESASDAKSQFMANMSHELRTPMNAIIGYSEMLMEDAEDDENEEAVADLGKINSAGKHLLELINAVLDLSKIEAGGMELHLEEFEVAEMISDVAVVTQPLIENKGNELATDLAEDLGAMRSDVTKIRQSLLNLLSNAAKFTEHDTITLRATREVRDGEDWLLFAVEDHGTGIPADKLEHVFEEFAQASSTTARDYGGTGLGLPLTRRICRLLGGDVVLESELGRGSVFTLELPAAGPADQEGATEAAAAPLVAARPDGDRPDVLVIDDDPHARELLVRGLEREGYRVVTAPDGRTGLELARSLRPALITLDIIMPNLDGWAVLAALKDDPATASIPVAMLSIAPDHELGLLLGAVESLTKPIDRDVLYELVKKFVVSDTFRVLVVDDDESSRALICRYGEAAGWQLDEADNGAVALERIDADRPDLILLDLMMPVMDGFEVLDHLRANPDHRDIPVVVLTAKNLTDEDHSRLQGNVEKIIEKGQRSAAEVLDYLRGVLEQE